MTSIGTFGRKYARVDLDFEFFELVVRVNPSVSKAAMVEFLAVAGTVDQDDEIQGAQIIMQMMREVIHPDDFEAFWTTAKRERQDPQEDLMPIAQKIIEATADFPTGAPSGSPNGDTGTPQRFAVDVPLPDSYEPPVMDGTVLQALKIQGDRPDLHMQVPAVARYLET